MALLKLIFQANKKGCKSLILSTTITCLSLGMADTEIIKTKVLKKKHKQGNNIDSAVQFL